MLRLLLLHIAKNVKDSVRVGVVVETWHQRVVPQSPQLCLSVTARTAVAVPLFLPSLAVQGENFRYNSGSAEVAYVSIWWGLK